MRQKAKLYNAINHQVRRQTGLHAGVPGGGISSNGRAPALHAGGTGIDTQILHFFFLLFELNVFA